MATGSTREPDDSNLPPEILGITGPANAAQRDADINTIAAMTQYGGSFVKQLAELCYHADADHLRRIKEAFPEYWDRYTHIHASRDQTAAVQTRVAQAAGEKDVVYCRHSHKHYSAGEALACDEHHRIWGS